MMFLIIFCLRFSCISGDININENVNFKSVSQFDDKSGKYLNKDQQQGFSPQLKGLDEKWRDSDQLYDKEWEGKDYKLEYAYDTDKNGYLGFAKIRRGKNFYNEEEKETLDKFFGYTGPTANDEPENLIRPCALTDWDCIRYYFAANSKCIPAYGPIPDPIKRELYTFIYSAVNLTATFTDFTISGLSSAKVNDFYVNKKSGNLVFTIDLENINFTSPRVYFRYRRTAKESIVLADFSTVNFRAATLTSIVPKVPNLRLDLAEIHVDIKDGFPIFITGPGASNSTDPDVVTAFAQFPILQPFLVREASFLDSPLMASIFIQTYICDFGLKAIIA